MNEPTITIERDTMGWNRWYWSVEQGDYGVGGWTGTKRVARRAARRAAEAVVS